jgi:DNA polymerase
LGRDFRITQSRGQVMTSPWAEWTVSTFHPSALLRIPDPDLRAKNMADFESDLRLVAEQLKTLRRK